MQTGVLLREILRLKTRLAIRHYKKQVGNTIAMAFAWLGMFVGVSSGALALVVHLHTSGVDRQEEAGRVLTWIFWILTLIWMFSPFAQIDVQRNLDLNGLRQYPLSGSQFLYAVLLDALASPLSIFVLPFTLIFMGVVAFAGMAILPMLVSLVLATLILLCYTQGLFLLVNRLLQSRRFSEMSMLLGIVIVIIVQVVNFSFIGGVDEIGGSISSSPLARYLLPVLAVLEFSFPSLAARAAAEWSNGQLLPALAAWGMMLVWLVPGVLFVGRTARSFYEGELESGGLSDERTGGDRSRGIAGLLPAGLLAVLVEREQRYARRDPMLRSLLIQSMFFGIYTCIVMLLMRGRILEGGSLVSQQHIMNYVLLGLSFGLTYSESGVLFNRFGYEGSSMTSLLASSVPRQKILVAKSIFLMSHMGALNLLLVLVMGILLGCSPMYIAAAFLMVIANLCIVDMAGNFLSIAYPFAFVRQGRKIRPVMPQQGCGYIFLYGLLFNVCNLFVMPGSLAIVLGTIFYDLPGLLGGALIAWLLAGLLWHIGLGQATLFLESREQRLLEVLCRQPD